MHLCGESRKTWKEGWEVAFAVGGAHAGRWGVAFVLFAMAVVGIGVSFARIIKRFQKHKTRCREVVDVAMVGNLQRAQTFVGIPPSELN